MAPYLDVCRLCAQKKKLKISLFECDSSLLEKISNCLNLNITSEDVLPKMICFECQRNIEQFYAFKQKCLKAEENLKKIAVTPSSQKTLLIVKEEIAEEQRTQHNPLTDHNYPALQVLQSNTHNVKTELAVDSQEQDSTEVIFEFERNVFDVKKPLVEVFVGEDVEGYLHEEAKPVIEASDDLDLAQLVVVDAVADQESTPVDTNYDFEAVSLLNGNPISKAVKYGVLNNEHIVCDFPIEDRETESFEIFPPETTETSKISLESSKNQVIREFEDSDLMLGKDEQCDVDMELMEATLKKKAQPNMRFSCRICKKSFKFYKGLQKHRRTHDLIDVTYDCHFCLSGTGTSHQFTTLNTLKCHIMTVHLREKEYKCRLCEDKFRTRMEHKRHLQNFHGPIMHKCFVCPKWFKLRSVRNMHMRVHYDVKPFICEQCGRQFRWRGALRFHADTHSKEEKFLCSVCGKNFSSKHSLAQHVNTHLVVKSYLCSICGQGFNYLTALRNHEKSHKLPDHICTRCGRAFSFRHLLKQHIAFHTGVKPFICNVCSRAFSNKSNLLNHSKIHQERRFVCESCGRKFARSHQLRDHMMLHTGSKHKCPVPQCDKMYSQRFTLTRHCRKHHPGLIILSRKGGRRRDGAKAEVPTQSVMYKYEMKL